MFILILKVGTVKQVCRKLLLFYVHRSYVKKNRIIVFLLGVGHLKNDIHIHLHNSHLFPPLTDFKN